MNKKIQLTRTEVESHLLVNVSKSHKKNSGLDNKRVLKYAMENINHPIKMTKRLLKEILEYIQNELAIPAHLTTLLKIQNWTKEDREPIPDITLIQSLVV